MKRCAALQTSRGASFIDHIAPLASLLRIPLIATEEEHVSKIKNYYPEVELRYWPDLSFRLKELCSEFDTLIECNYWAEEFRQLLLSCYGKKMRLIFCPHGQSDKGYGAPLLSPYALQEAVFLYGNLMKKMLKELKIPLKLYSEVGNYRFLYYQMHRTRHLEAAQKEIFSKMNSSYPTLLYAPTWNDLDQATTFFEMIERLILEKPADWNLLIKAHPLLEEREPARFYRLAKEIQNVVLTHDFPLVYPLLELSDAYLGDYSSIGYDALAFKKPLFFLAKSHLTPSRLHCCGEILDPTKPLFQTLLEKIPQSMRFEKQKRKLYQRAFNSRANVHQAAEALIG